MKFRVTFKTPDAVYDAIHDEANKIMKRKREVMEDALGYTLTDPEVEAITQARVYEMSRCADKFVEFGEYITIEFDPKENTAKVVPVRETTDV